MPWSPADALFPLPSWQEEKMVDLFSQEHGKVIRVLVAAGQHEVHRGARPVQVRRRRICLNVDVESCAARRGFEPDNEFDGGVGLRRDRARWLEINAKGFSGTVPVNEALATLSCCNSG